MCIRITLAIAKITGLRIRTARTVTGVRSKMKGSIKSSKSNKRVSFIMEQGMGCTKGI